ncbi:MAG: hypothetical protein PHF86_01540 [Candidatus Nanoarchaeia archaeon]|nr:hypothetical protein [Candidatus Nanoarchaeia archaeon]
MRAKYINELFEFERKQDPIESMEIGLKNHPIKVTSVIKKIIETKGEISKAMIGMSPSEIVDTLEKLSKSQKIRKDFKLEDILFFEDVEGTKYVNVYTLNEIKGYWISYKDNLYHIPQNKKIKNDS